MSFIQSLKGKKSHYFLHERSKVYLPEELDATKLDPMYNDSNNSNKKYTTFREVFEGNFNISFGYSRKDTCSSCDTFKANIAITTDKMTVQ